jgi:hypothetical protein
MFKIMINELSSCLLLQMPWVQERDKRLHRLGVFSGGIGVFCG